MSEQRDLIRQTLYPSSMRRKPFAIGYQEDDAANTTIVKFKKEQTDKTDNNDDDDDDEDNDGNDTDTTTTTENEDETEEPISADIVTNKIQLPGGVASLASAIDQVPEHFSIGEMPQALVTRIRFYVDILFSSVMLESRRIINTVSKPDSSLAIPGVVTSILQYNNIEFRTIRYRITKLDLPEPVWYTIDIKRNELIIYINEAMYNDFCAKSNELKVNFTSGSIPLHLHNPISNRTPDVPIDWPMIHCAIAADHVAQHIITDLFITNKNRYADIHERFTEHGTTLHSIFKLEQICKQQHTIEFNNYLSINSPSAAAINHPFLGCGGNNNFVGQPVSSFINDLIGNGSVVGNFAHQPNVHAAGFNA